MGLVRSISVAGGVGLGRIATTGAPASGAWGAANRAIYLPFVVESACRLDSVSVHVGAAVADSVEYAVYSFDGRLIATTGALTPSTSGWSLNTVRTEVFTTTPRISPGRYYLGMASSTTTMTYFRTTPTGSWATFRPWGILTQETAYPLPSLATFAATSNNYSPQAWVNVTGAQDKPVAVMPHTVNAWSYPNSLALLNAALAESSNGGATWPANDDAIFVPVRVTERCLVKVLWCMNGGVASGNIDVGIYTPDGTRIVSGGGVAQSGTSNPQNFDITDTVLDVGDFLIALALSSTVGTAFRAAASVEYMKAFGCYKVASAYPLPATVTLATPDAAYLPNFGFTLQTLI